MITRLLCAASALAACLAFGHLCIAGTVDLSRDGVEVSVSHDPETVDVGRDFYVTVTVTAPSGRTPLLPDLRDRFRGFGVAEDFTEDPAIGADGRTTLVSRWRLVPEPVARKYALAPFVVACVDEKASTLAVEFATAPVSFDPPGPRETVTGGMEIDPHKDLPPFSWRLAGACAAALAALAALVVAAWWTVRKVRTMIRVHRMSPIQRALYELELLLQKGLPGRGRYKDFYVELTMVVRRYIERRHGVRAPHLTTDEFLRAAEASPAFTRESIAQLREFLQSADMVKFAGVEATPVMADAATDSAKNYLRKDSET